MTCINLLVETGDETLAVSQAGRQEGTLICLSTIYWIHINLARYCLCTYGIQSD